MAQSQIADTFRRRATEPLPRRSGLPDTTATWTTQRGDGVTVGACVALDLLGDKDCVARIEGTSATRAILCVVIQSVYRDAIGKYLLVAEDQLLMEIP